MIAFEKKALKHGVNVFDYGSAYKFNSDDESSDSIEYDDTEVFPFISNSTVIKSLNNLIKWCSYSKLFPTKHLRNLLTLRNDIIASDLKKKKKQNKQI